jgi:hypothetical protein
MDLGSEKQTIIIQKSLLECCVCSLFYRTIPPRPFRTRDIGVVAYLRDRGGEKKMDLINN